MTTENRIKGLGKQTVTERELMARIQATLPVGQTLHRTKTEDARFSESEGYWYPASPLGWHYIMSDKQQGFHPFDHNWDHSNIVLADLDLENLGRAKGVLAENEVLEAASRVQVLWCVHAKLHPEVYSQSESEKEIEELLRDIPEVDEGYGSVN